MAAVLTQRATAHSTNVAPCTLGATQYAQCERPAQRLNLLIGRSIGGDLHHVPLVLTEPGVDTQDLCLRTSVGDCGVVRRRRGVMRVGDDADLVLTHPGGMRDEHVSRFQIRERRRMLLI